MDSRVVFYSEVQNIVPVPCACERQMCKGLYIPSRIGQETCLFDLAERRIIDNFPYIKDKRYTTAELLIFVLKWREASVPDEAEIYEITDPLDSLEEMVD